MKRLCASIFALITFATGFAYKSVDSLSYALGYQMITILQYQDVDFITNEDDAKNFVIGMKDGITGRYNSSDSTYLMSYYAGVLQATFMTDPLAVRAKEDWPPLECMVEGLKLVANNQIILPRDTAEATAYVKQLHGKRLSELDRETQCEAYRAIGVLKPYTPQLEEYINEFQPDSHYEVNRQAFAEGMISILESFVEPETPYTYGKSYSRMIATNSGQLDNINLDMLISGAEAAFGIAAPLIPAKEIEQLILHLNQEQTDTE